MTLSTLNEKRSLSQSLSHNFTLSVIVPCYNEEKIIDKTIQDIVLYLKSLKEIHNWELILVNDGSTDNTLEVIKSKSSKNIKVVSFQRNRGRGKAIHEGINSATGDYIICLDADLSYDLDHISRILEAFKQNSKTDVVVVSAYMKGGSTEGVPFTRLALSKIANWILSSFFPKKLSTVTCVVRGYRKEIIQRVCLLENGKEFHLEVLKKLFLKNAEVEEIPGRLVWKREKNTKSSKRKLNIIRSSNQHLIYALALKPHTLFKYLTIILFLIGLYEAAIFTSQVINELSLQESIAKSLWLAIKTTFDHSPHTFFISLGCLILGLNSFSFLFLFYIVRLNQDENMRHLLAIFEEISSKRNEQL